MAGKSSGWIYGAAGMLIFSASLPATKLAVTGFDPVFLTLARAAIAGLIAGLLLLIDRAALPQRGEWARLGIVALGVVAGFPLLTALALKSISSIHAVLYTGLLPVATASFAVLRAGEKPRPVFWLCALAGSLVVAVYVLRQEALFSPVGDGLMVLAILVCGLGYAEGARLSRKFGGWRVISWALVLTLPVSLGGALLRWPGDLAAVGSSAWLGLAYVSLFSMLIGFFFWYRGLAEGGIAAVGQLQLLQPFFGVLLAAALLGEPVRLMLFVTMGIVAACVAGARRFAS
ncbi:DMT family transporter [Radicibacter daui]|uniref:DMT family transporter n=1 Tax=Radicibacter daui TaxID=3064829 RepID=UPI004046D68B